jgi:Mn2+/Fe2+ NRAMP family transporter
MFISQVINGLVLLVVLTFMLLLVNHPSVMSEHTDGLILNLLSWAIVIILVGLSIVTVASGLWKSYEMPRQ